MQLYEIKIWEELKSLPLLISRLKQNKNNVGIDIKDAANMVSDIDKYLAK